MEENQHTTGSRDQGGTSHCDLEEYAVEDVSNSLVLPAEALFYALPYMSLPELLSMEQVCRASREWVRDGVVLWRRLHVERPLSRRLTDEVLLRLSKRSCGQLECLCIVDCLRISEGAVEQVVLKSPRLTKLFLPGCNRLSADGVVSMVKTHTEQCKKAAMPGLKELKLRNIPGLTEHHLQSLVTIMGTPPVPHLGMKLHFYHEDDLSHLCGYQDRPIDVEICPKCRNVTMVYDCTREECQAKQACRACALCIVRCAECGACLQDDELNETVCLDFLCLSCWLKLPKCAECNRPACGRHLGNLEEQKSSLLCDQCLDFSLLPSDLLAHRHEDA